MIECPYLQEYESFNTVRDRLGQNQWNIHNYRDAFEPIFEFSNNQLMVPFGLSAYPDTGNPFINPFNAFSLPNGVPQWWNVYNGLKHDYYEKLVQATLDNVINSVGALLILNSLHLCSREYLARYNIIQGELRRSYTDNEFVQRITQSPIGIPVRITPLHDSNIRTQLFVYEYRIDNSRTHLLNNI